MAKDSNAKSSWLIVSPDGSMQSPEKFDFLDEEDLRVFYQYESSGSREVKDPPAHVKLMQGLELVDYEPASDSGNFRWMPRGHLLKRLMEGYVSGIMRNYGAMQVETPVMYDLKHPALSTYLSRFPSKQYTLKSGDREFFLRFAACFGQYLIMHDMQISYTDLPLRIYELTHYSFRREKSGEVAGLRRLRVFTMPDMHTLCSETEQAKMEFWNQYQLSKQWMEGLGGNYVMAIRVVKDFFEQNREFVLGIVKDLERPVLLEVWDERLFYFIMKFEFNVVDGQGKAAALSTVQIDVENCERFGIQYTGADGQKKTPLMLHASISGSVDRNLYAILENQARKMQENQVASLPYWLSPTQAILLPITDKHFPRCLELAEKMNGHVRVEVDDTQDSIGKRVRNAAKKWVPYTIVIGDKELENGTLAVRTRDGVSEMMTLDQFSQAAASAQKRLPFEPINWSLLVSRQPRFR